jgi:hypothetical protein
MAEGSRRFVTSHEVAWEAHLRSAGHRASSGTDGGVCAEARRGSPSTRSLSVGRHFHTATLLSDGIVLVAGGAWAESRASAELYHSNDGR